MKIAKRQKNCDLRLRLRDFCINGQSAVLGSRRAFLGDGKHPRFQCQLSLFVFVLLSFFGFWVGENRKSLSGAFSVLGRAAFLCAGVVAFPQCTYPI